MDQQKKHGRGGGSQPQPREGGGDQSSQSKSQSQSQQTQMKWVPKGQKSEEPQVQQNDQSQQQDQRPQQSSNSNRGRGRGSRGGYRQPYTDVNSQQTDQSNQNQQQEGVNDGYSQKEYHQSAASQDQTTDSQQQRFRGGRGSNNYRGRGGQGRGNSRGGYQQTDYNADQQVVTDAHSQPQQQDEQSTYRGGRGNQRGNRGSRGGYRGNRGGYQQQNNQSDQDHQQESSVSSQQDDKNTSQQQLPSRGGRGGNRESARGNRGGRGQRGGYQGGQIRDSDYFEDRKYERDQFEGGMGSYSNSNASSIMQQHGGDAKDRLWSKKMDTQSKAKHQMGKNLGSASQYLASSGGDGDARNQYLPTKNEKIGYINDEDEKREMEAKEKAQINYNYQDFLNQFENLTEQCTYFVESMSKGTQECIICHNPIFQRSAVWNCDQCHQPHHLGCIKRWIKKINNVDDDQEEVKVAPGQQNRRGQLEQRDDYDSEEEKQYESEAKKAAKKLLAFYSWTCPNCNFAYAENNMPRYLCFCGRYDEPPYSPLILPHSCGEYCDRKRNDICTHGRCDVLCHPGSCPPCGIQVPIKCFCGKDTKRVPCQLSQRSLYSCQQECGRLLNCQIHECQDECHQGQCKKCDIDIQQKCFCGKEERTVKCGTKVFLCQKICGKQLDCGNHSCQKVCHDGPCQPCQKVPSKVKFCPCGRKEITTLINTKRNSCLDPIPCCQGKCEKFLPCGKHQCTLTCHNDDCMKCEELVEQICLCGKEKRKLKCYQLNYPEHLRQEYMTQEEIDDIDFFKCKRICNQLQSCKKHKCRDLCCPVKKGQDPYGKHLCLKTCNKTLSCGKHQCNGFCHLGLCKPCRYVSTQPLPCPCGSIKIDPPIKCGTQQPTCNNNCGKPLPCGHKCNVKCHLGNCPPCLEIVTKVCNCGKEIMPNVFCNQQKHSCGAMCKIELPCGHNCQKVCHLRGSCFKSLEDIMQNGCGEACGKQRTLCKHRCLESCHPNMECPENPCDAEIRVYCKCGYRFVNTLCKSMPERDPIECSSECWKHQREKKLAMAFAGGKSDFEQNRDINLEYYPEEVLEFAQQYPKFVKKCETQLTDIVLEKSVRSFSGLGTGKKSFLTTLVFEHFKLDMCTYGGKNQKTVTDVFWKEGCKVPDMMVTDIIQLIEKGILSSNNDDNRNQIFEATLYIFNVQKGTTIDDLKKFMSNFKNEMYTQKGKQQGSYYIHFYRKMRAKDALTYIKNSPNQFTNVELIMHMKEIGTIELTPAQQESAIEKKKAAQRQQVIDDDGFMTVVKKK